jgi:hypothetical protein
MAFCERFPRLPADVTHQENGHPWAYLAQAGKSTVSRHNFDDIFTSFVTIFQILTGVHISQRLSDFEPRYSARTLLLGVHYLHRERCAGENWNSVMYDGMRTTRPYAALYFLFIVIIGNYVVLNLFLAILLDKFASGNEKDDTHGQAIAAPDNDSVHLSGLVEEEEEGEGDDALKTSRAMYLLGLHVRIEP